MPARYRIFPEHNLIVSVLEGRLTDEDLLGQQDQLRRDPRFRPDLRQVVDASGATQAAVTSDGIRTAARNTTLGPATRRAIIAPSPSHYGLARMFQLSTRADEDTIAVFRTRAEACAWLGVSEELVISALEEGSALSG